MIYLFVRIFTIFCLTILYHNNDAVVGAAKFGFTNETIGAKYGYFNLDDSTGTSTFRCIDDGARCVFQRSDYNDYNFGSGQETENEQGAVWAALNSSADILTLEKCIVATDTKASNTNTNNVNCLVVCNANCTCTDEETKEACTKLDEQPATNDFLQTDPPAANQYTSCPKQVFQEHCPTLMNDPIAMPPGLEGNYDCYNFCGGIFVSSCNLQNGNCGSLTCANATADGTVTGRVQGCTDADRIKPQDGTTTAANGNTDGTGTTSSAHGIVQLGAWRYTISAYVLLLLGTLL